MFITTAFIILGLISLLVLWDWIEKRLFLHRKIQRSLKNIEKKILLERWKEAEKELLPLLKGGKKETYLYFLQVLRGTKRYEEGYQVVDELTSTRPEELAYQLEKGRFLLALEKYKEAYQAFTAASPLIRSENDLLDYAEAALLSEESEASWALVEPLLSRGKSGRLYTLAGDLCFEKRAFGEALQWYHKAVELGVESVELITKLGHAYRRFGNLAEAEKIFQQVLEKDGADASAILGLGACLQERGNHARALLLFQNCALWEVKKPAILFQAALSALHLGRFAYAAAYFEEVIAQQGLTVKLLLYYGYALEGEGLWTKAEKNYHRLVHTFPNEAAGYLALGWLFGVGLSTGLSAEIGLQYAYRALQLSPQAEQLYVYEVVSACEARVGNFNKAHQIQGYLSEIDPQNRARRQEMMRHLRKNLPLGNKQVQKALAA